MNNFKVTVKRKIINKKLIDDICKLKNQSWNYGLKNQRKWFSKNIKKDDLHLILKDKFKLIGYVLLRKRSFLIKDKILGKYFFFDTLIISDIYRNNKLSKLIMDRSNKIICSKKKFGVLMCKKKMINFYKKFNWVINEKINVINSKKNKTIMTYNAKNISRVKIDINN